MVVACSRKRVVFGRIFEVKAEQSAWESVGVGGILGKLSRPRMLKTMRIFLVAIVVGGLQELLDDVG